MGCGCGSKKGILPNRANGIPRSVAVNQNIVRSSNNINNSQPTPPAAIGMDKNRLEIERKRREAIKKSLGKMI